jgi:hypothetical protein
MVEKDYHLAPSVDRPILITISIEVSYLHLHCLLVFPLIIIYKIEVAKPMVF